ncbi:hypothetical protein PC129_g7404, partial [Phytophthora cactorum]
MHHAGSFFTAVQSSATRGVSSLVENLCDTPSFPLKYEWKFSPSNPPPRGKMFKLFCAIVGEAGSVFPVDIDAGQSVGDLKDAIKAKKPNKITCDADELQLFLAKTDDGAWLSSLTEDVKKLKKGEKTVFIEALTQEEQELQAEDPLED